MNIVIIGVGDIGRYVAALFSKEQHNVILVDKDPQKLEEAAWQMDVATKRGSGTDWQLLEELLEFSPDLFIAVTSDDEINLTSCTIAKNLGYPRTIARVKDSRYLNNSRLDFGRLFDIDYFICPELLVAYDIFKHMSYPGTLAIEYFAHGAVEMRTIIVPEDWSNSHKPLRELKFPNGVVIGLIRSSYNEKHLPLKEQERRIFFPHGNDAIFPGDEVTFLGESHQIEEIHHFFGIKDYHVQSVVIIGGSQVGINLAKILSDHKIHVRLIDKDLDKCGWLSEQLPDCTIMHHDGTDLDFLLSEKIGQAEVFVACTKHDDLNLLAAALGKEVGCKQVVSVVSNSSYNPLLSKLNIAYAVSPWVSAANHILSVAFSGTISSLVSLYDHQAEIIEITASAESPIVGIPISQLGPFLPKDFLIGMIQNRGRIMIAHGNRIISPGDTVILVTSPKHLSELEKIF